MGAHPKVGVPPNLEGTLPGKTFDSISLWPLVYVSAERCTLEDRFLIVRGNLHTYRIHLISGNIFMEPEEKYLCIVFDTKLHAKQEERFFLPFEGDQLFSLILSKAFLLAEDNKITDPSILSQLRRG